MGYVVCVFIGIVIGIAIGVHNAEFIKANLK